MDILQIFTLLGALGMFLYGMNLMSSGLQKAAGDKLRGFLSAMTSNSFKGVMTGLGITSVIQSSSATTVMVKYCAKASSESGDTKDPSEAEIYLCVCEANI